MALIKCCRNCVPPKRHLACWGHCPEYAAEREALNQRKEADAKRRKVKNDIYSQRADNVTKALRKHRRN